MIIFHLFFQCSTSVKIWSGLKQIFSYLTFGSSMITYFFSKR